MSSAKTAKKLGGPYPQKVDLQDGNSMAAISAYHIDFTMMGYYPITPSTQVAETLDAFKAQGLHDITMVPGDGEHGASAPPGTERVVARDVWRSRRCIPLGVPDVVRQDDHRTVQRVHLLRHVVGDLRFPCVPVLPAARSRERLRESGHGGFGEAYPITYLCGRASAYDSSREQHRGHHEDPD